MPAPIDRRRFLRQAALSAATLGIASSAGTLAGCGSSSNPTGPKSPAPPTDLVAQAMSATRVTLAWNDNATNETSYEVERRAAMESAFTRIATIASDQTSYQDDSVGEKVLYAYRVRAVAEGLASEYSNEAEAMTPAAGTPIAPTDVQILSVSAGGAVVAWNDIVTNEGGFRIERVDGASPEVLLSLPANSSQGTLTGFAANSLVSVRVVAFNDSGDSPPSSPVGFLTGEVSANVVLTPLEPGKLRITWSDRSGGRVQPDVERDSGSGFAPIATLATGVVTFDDTSVPTGATVHYRVVGHGVASTAAGEGSLVVPASPPGAPQGFTAKAATGNGSRVALSWGPGSGSALGFQLQRRPATGSFTTLQTWNDLAQGSFEDATAAVLTPVVYRVLAWNLAGFSASSSEAPITPRAVFALTGSLAALNTINKGVAVQVNVSSRSLGSTCSSSKASIYLVRESQTSVAAVVAHCTHECLTPPSFHWVESSLRYVCSHGSLFDIHGVVKQGPANRNVPQLATVLFEDRVEVLGPGSTA